MLASEHLGFGKMTHNDFKTTAEHLKYIIPILPPYALKITNTKAKVLLLHRFRLNDHKYSQLKLERWKSLNWSILTFLSIKIPLHYMKMQHRDDRHRLLSFWSLLKERKARKFPIAKHFRASHNELHIFHLHPNGNLKHIVLTTKGTQGRKLAICGHDCKEKKKKKYFGIWTN